MRHKEPTALEFLAGLCITMVLLAVSWTSEIKLQFPDLTEFRRSLYEDLLRKPPEGNDDDITTRQTEEELEN
jgi:hypothetical protein